MSVSLGVEEPVVGTRALKTMKGDNQNNTPANMLFRALNLVFSSRSAAFTGSPPWRAAAFAKRLCMASLQFPPLTAARTLAFVRTLVSQEQKLEALLSTEDRMTDGIYHADVDDPQLCNAFATNLWELHVLSKHVDRNVKEAAIALLDYSRDQ